jgi:hypothetical protein
MMRRASLKCPGCAQLLSCISWRHQIGRERNRGHVVMLHGKQIWTWFHAQNVNVLFYVGSTSVLIYDNCLLLINLLSSADISWCQVTYMAVV